MFRNPVARLRAIGLFEGVSFLVLLGIAMPLKYVAGIPEAVKVVGWAHGLFFILFVIAVTEVAVARGWTLRRVAGALLAAVLPFGTFVLDARVLRDEERLFAQAAAPGVQPG